MQDMCSGWLILHKVNTSLVLCRTSHHLYNRTPASAKRVCRMLLLMPGLALHTAQSSFDSIVPRPVPASIADHVLSHMLQEQPAANNMQSSDDMQPSLLLSDVPCCKPCSFE
jgi:hypothetical protein